MLISKFIDVATFINLGRRYLQRRRADVCAIRRIKAEYYAQTWADAATGVGATINSMGADIFKISKSDRSISVYHQYTQFADSVTERLIVNKSIVHKILKEAEVPIPRFVLLENLDLATAKSFMAQVGGPVVVKPATGTGAGAGVTTNVASMSQLYRALAWSRAFSSTTIIEEQLKGHNFRLLFLDGELLDCIVRWPPTVEGDGLSSIRKLIRRENEKRVVPGSRLAQDLIYIDLDTKNTLAAQGMRLGTIPSKGEVVKVKDVINGNRAEENETVPRPPANSIVNLGNKIKDITGLRLVGVDIIAEDLTVDLKESSGCVIEVNTPPGHFYHQLRKGKGYPVAVRLLEAFFQENQVNSKPSRSIASARSKNTKQKVQEEVHSDS